MRPSRAAASATVVLVAGSCLTACAGDRLTASRLQASLGDTFARLYQVQQEESGDPVPTLDAIAARSTCQRGTPSTPQRGAGNDWVCQVTFLVDGPATPVVATYDVTLQTDGCYAADGDGPTSLNGQRTLSDGRTLNPLRLIDGCFDVG